MYPCPVFAFVLVRLQEYGENVLFVCNCLLCFQRIIYVIVLRGHPIMKTISLSTVLGRIILLTDVWTFLNKN